MPERSADPGGSRGCPKMHKAAAVLGALAVTSGAPFVQCMFGLEPDLAPRCVESASCRATALRVATADPPDPGSLPLRQELAQLRAEGLRGAGGRARDTAPRQQKGPLLAAIARRGRCYPVKPGPVHVLRRYLARGPPAGPLQAFRRAHSLNRARMRLASPLTWRLDVGLDRTQEAPAAEDRDYTCPPPRPPGGGRVAGRAGGRWAVGSCKWRGRGGCRVSKFTPSAPTSARTTPPWRQGRAAAVHVTRGARLRLLGPLGHGLARRLAADVI